GTGMTGQGSVIQTRDHAFLMSVFRSVVRDRTTTITASELQRALANGTWKPFSEDLVNMMVKLFDRNFDGCIDFEEFVCLWHHITEWINVFKSEPPTFASGDRLNKTELQSAFMQLNFRLSLGLCHVMIRRFDQSGDNRINVADFVRLCIILQYATEAFKTFDTGQVGQAKITYDQFLTTMFKMAR
ncbi:programmed cell death-involved protein, putative, partial [Ixodes scapularis]